MSVIRHGVGQPTLSPSFAVGQPTPCVGGPSLCRDSDMSSVVDVERWTAGECREYLRYAPVEYAPAALVSRVRTRLASLQLAELWPVDPRD